MMWPSMQPSTARWRHSSPAFVRSGPGPQAPRRQPPTNVPVALRADRLVADDLVADRHLLVLIDPSLPDLRLATELPGHSRRSLW